MNKKLSKYSQTLYNISDKKIYSKNNQNLINLFNNH